MAASRGITVEVHRNGALTAATDDPTAMTGETIGLVRHVANVLDAFGERLRAGEVIITGSTVPLVFLDPPESVDYDAGSLGRLSLSFRS